MAVFIKETSKEPLKQQTEDEIKQVLLQNKERNNKENVAMKQSSQITKCATKHFKQ